MSENPFTGEGWTDVSSTIMEIESEIDGLAEVPNNTLVMLTILRAIEEIQDAITADHDRRYEEIRRANRND